MSAAVSASRTCNVPDRISTMRSRSCALAPSMRDLASIGRTGFSIKVPLITPGDPGRFWGGLGGVQPNSFAPVEPASDYTHKSFRAGSRFTHARHRVEFKPMADEFVAELISDDFLQSFDLFVAEFDHPAGVQVDQMVVVSARHFLVAGAPIAEIVSSQNTRLFKQPHSSIHRSDTNARIDRGGSTVDPLDVGVIDRLRQHPSDHPALFRHLQTLVKAELLQPRDHHISTVTWLYHTVPKSGGRAYLRNDGGPIEDGGFPAASRPVYASRGGQARGRRARVPRPISFARRLRWRA